MAGAIAILDRVSWTESLEEAAAFADVVIECIVEDLAVKQDYFQKLDGPSPSLDGPAPPIRPPSA